MNRACKQRGFTMIELMVAVVVGLVVSGAAVLLVASIVKSNSETLRATRLTQELRATTEVIARDLRRARSVSDPITNVDLASASQITGCNAINTATAGCVQIGYDCDTTTTGVFRTFGLVGNSVKLVTGTASLVACPTTSTGITISSPAVKITGLTFSPATSNDTGDTDYTITVAGQLVYQPAVSNSVTLATLSRSYTQHVRIRAAAVQ